MKVQRIEKIIMISLLCLALHHLYAQTQKRGDPFTQNKQIEKALEKIKEQPCVSLGTVLNASNSQEIEFIENFIDPSHNNAITTTRKMHIYPNEYLRANQQTLAIPGNNSKGKRYFSLVIYPIAKTDIPEGEDNFYRIKKYILQGTSAQNLSFGILGEENPIAPQQKDMFINLELDAASGKFDNPELISPDNAKQAIKNYKEKTKEYAKKVLGSAAPHTPAVEGEREEPAPISQVSIGKILNNSLWNVTFTIKYQDRADFGKEKILRKIILHPYEEFVALDGNTIQIPGQLVWGNLPVIEYTITNDKGKTLITHIIQKKDEGAPMSQDDYSPILFDGKEFLSSFDNPILDIEIKDINGLPISELSEINRNNLPPQLAVYTTMDTVYQPNPTSKVLFD